MVKTQKCTVSVAITRCNRLNLLNLPIHCDDWLIIKFIKLGKCGWKNPNALSMINYVCLSVV